MRDEVRSGVRYQRWQPPLRGVPRAMYAAHAMRLRRSARFMRVTATCLLFCLGFLAVESFIADACDGDARDQEHVEFVALDAGGAAVHASDRSDDASRSPAQHSLHVDHCAHPHVGGPVTAAIAVAFPGVPAAALRIAAVNEPASVEREPHIRPPIV